MANGTGHSPIESIGTFVGRRLRHFTLVAAGANLLLCLLFLFVVMRANSERICLLADANIQSYIESLSREIVIGNREHIATMLGTLQQSGLLGDVQLQTTPDSQGAGSRQCRFNGLRLEFETPILFGTRPLGSLQGSIAWISVAQIAAFIGAVALLSLGLMGLATRFLARELHRALVAPIGKLARGEAPGGAVLVSDVLKIKQDLEASRENAKYAALASMTQMVAHDVRKPFSMIQIVLHGIAAARTLGEVKNIAGPASREIQRALESVSNMLSDIMEIGHETALSCEPASPRLLIDAAIREACRLSPESHVTFSASLKHTHCVQVDVLKIQRVFSNIIGNAMQALEAQEGRIWFRTRAPGVAGPDRMELTVGNTGRPIEPEDMDRLFDAFFTKGKKQGTGLGLAIAKKVIEAHGGRIGCRSSPQTGVEFWFTLPTSPRIDTAEVALPHASAEVREAQRRVPADVDAFGEDAQAEACEMELMRRLAGRRLKVLVLDDEALHRNALGRLLHGLEHAGPLIDVLAAGSGEEALAQAVANPDVGLFDYDLGASPLDGIQTLRAMRERVPGMCICLHSNRLGGVHYQQAVEAGAAHFLPKPMSKVHLLRILGESLPACSAQSPAPLLAESTCVYRYSEAPVFSAWPAGVALPASGVVAVLDDCPVHRNGWVHKSLGQPLVTFESPEVFAGHLRAHPGFFDTLAFIVTDYHFGTASAMNGLEFARTIAGKPVFLASQGEIGGGLSPAAGVLPRKIMDWDALHAFCAGRLDRITR